MDIDVISKYSTAKNPKRALNMNWLKNCTHFKLNASTNTLFIKQTLTKYCIVTIYKDV